MNRRIAIMVAASMAAFLVAAKLATMLPIDWGLTLFGLFAYAGGTTSRTRAEWIKTGIWDWRA